MTKRFLILTLAAVLLLCTCTAASADSGRLSREEAWARAIELVDAGTRYTRDQLTREQLGYEDGVWFFSLKLKEPAEDEDGLLVGEMDGAGNLLRLSAPQKISLEAQLERELQACWHRDDSDLRLAEVTEKWAPKLAALSKEELDAIWPQYVGVIRLGISVPPVNVLNRKDAYLAAMTHLAEAEGWTAEIPDLYALWVSAYYVLDGTPVWFFGLERHSWMEDEYFTDAAMNLYDRKLDTAFEAIGQEAPYSIGVLVNALTGQLVEKPMLDYIPTVYNYLDFLVRTDEAVAGITE